MIWRVKLLHLGSSRFFLGLYKGQGVAGELLEDLGKKKNYARQRLEWLLPISSTRSRPSFEVVTSRTPGAQGRGGCARSSAHNSASASPQPGQRAHDLG